MTLLKVTLSLLPTHKDPITFEVLLYLYYIYQFLFDYAATLV